MRPRNKPPGSSDEVVEQHQQQLEKQLSSSRSGRAVQSVRAGGMDRPSRTKSPGWVTLPPANQAGIPVGSIVYLCLCFHVSRKPVVARRGRGRQGSVLPTLDKPFQPVCRKNSASGKKVKPPK